MTLETTPPALPFKDRKTGLIVFGSLLIVIGAFFLLTTLVSVLSQAVLAGRPESAGRFEQRALLSSILSSGLFATAGIWLGIGSILSRRWARAIILCCSWFGLVVGIAMSALFIWMLPEFAASMQSADKTGQAMPELAVTVMKITMVVFLLLFYVILPGALILFYRSPHVKATCEARNPAPCWTDRCPLPVLTMVLIQAFGAFSMLSMTSTYGRVFPLCGPVLTGLPAMACYLFFVIVSVYAAWGFYHLQVRAYWIYLITMLFGSVSSVITFSGGRLMSYYRSMGLPQEQLDAIAKTPMVQYSGSVWIVGIVGLTILGYLLWLRKFFTPATQVARATTA